VSAYPIDPDTIRGLLAPERQRPVTPPGLPGVRVDVDGRPAIVHAAYEVDQADAQRIARLALDRHEAAQLDACDPDAWRHEPWRRLRTEANLARLAGSGVVVHARRGRVGAR
jgi:hypothetical protein